MIFECRIGNHNTCLFTSMCNIHRHGDITKNIFVVVFIQVKKIQYWGAKKSSKKWKTTIES